ncbi:TonB-dependent receptor [Paraglaciecola sp. T6c]|uniref:TonB-dependent receptor n=1 Tax=Pseudoalteromonas atlantica (strain T6c / ATCC BAA-1087) TaxID=3042615 RepID=UPI00005C5A28|nr:TonB-dependent receptor [Paraglaciecola sp. T6c]ABG38827.1 TonB-dependent receptor [Paraglaciecola sp. T6c]
MNRISPLAALISVLLPASVLAQTIEGTVVNNDGRAVAGATVEVEGVGIETITDQEGRFTFTELTQGKNELHISSPGFAHLHQDISVPEQGTRQIEFILQRSPIEVIDVYATPIHMSVMESASPVSVLSGETLRRQQASTLGDSLEKLPGVQSNFHGGVASTPIIRGLSGPRVLISQNGLDVSDVSRVGPDHSVASEASTSQQIEVLRGPATLFYGSGAVGGVVNVVDGRVPSDNTTRGEWLLETSSVDDKKLGSFNVTTGYESFGFYADGYWRESNDYDVPVAPDADSNEPQEHVVKNSSEKSDGITLGASYLMDQGYIGVAVEQFNREYGIPGHSHGGEDESVYADLEQTRVQLLGELNLDNEWLSKINLRGGFTDYEHAEIEEGAVGTLFENETHELKLDFIHTPFADWNGGLSIHYKNSDVAAQGEEAFTPPSEAQTIALAIMEEKHFGDVLLQFGARIERVTIDANNVLLPTLEAHAHDDEAEEDEHDHDHEHEEEASVTRVFELDHEFTPVSLSAGLVWDFTPGYNLGLSISRSERAPSAAELLSFGAHIGTGTYEVGALFALNDEGSSIGLTSKDIDLETANNIDLTLRKTQGDIGFVFNAFYNQVDNYYYQTATGLFAESGHDHEHEHEESGVEEDEHADELPVYIFQTDDVILHGFEAQIAWQATDEFKATLFSDYVRARLKDGGDLPRTPPLRFGTQFSYQTAHLSAHLDITRYQEQDRVSSDETSTSGYTLIDASVSYYLPVFSHDIAVFLKGNNLTDTEARVHTSFLKDIAPRPGRSISVGIRGNF